jgi:hypothetical protein
MKNQLLIAIYLCKELKNYLILGIKLPENLLLICFYAK